SISPPSSSPVPRKVARLMFSAGILTALAAAMAVRNRAFESGSPPDRAAMVISLMRRVNTLPRLESAAAFLCLIVDHLLCPDISEPQSIGVNQLMEAERRYPAGGTQNLSRFVQSSTLADAIGCGNPSVMKELELKGIRLAIS